MRKRIDVALPLYQVEYCPFLVGSHASIERVLGQYNAKSISFSFPNWGRSICYVDGQFLLEAKLDRDDTRVVVSY